MAQVSLPLLIFPRDRFTNIKSPGYKAIIAAIVFDFSIPSPTHCLFASQKCYTLTNRMAPCSEIYSLNPVFSRNPRSKIGTGASFNQEIWVERTVPLTYSCDAITTYHTLLTISYCKSLLSCWLLSRTCLVIYYARNRRHMWGPLRFVCLRL